MKKSDAVTYVSPQQLEEVRVGLKTNGAKIDSINAILMYYRVPTGLGAKYSGQFDILWHCNGSVTAINSFITVEYTMRQLNKIFGLGYSDQDLVHMKLIDSGSGGRTFVKTMTADEFVGDHFTFLV